MEFNILERQNIAFHLIPEKEVFEYFSISHPQSNFIIQDIDLQKLYQEYKNCFVSFSICKN